MDKWCREAHVGQHLPSASLRSLLWFTTLGCWAQHGIRNRRRFECPWPHWPRFKGMNFSEGMMQISCKLKKRNNTCETSMKAYDTSSAARCHLGQAWESLQAAWPTLRWERSVFSFLLSRFGSSNPGEQETMKKRTFEFAIKTRPRSLSQHGTISQIGKKCRRTSSHAIFVRKLFFIWAGSTLANSRKQEPDQNFEIWLKTYGWEPCLLSIEQPVSAVQNEWHGKTEISCGKWWPIVSEKFMWLSQLLAAEYAGSNLWCLRQATTKFNIKNVSMSPEDSGCCGLRKLSYKYISSSQFIHFVVAWSRCWSKWFFSTYFDLFRCFAQHLHPTSGSPGWSASITGPGTPGAQIPLSSNGFGCQQIPSSPFTRERRPFCKWLLWRSRELKRSKLTKIIQEWNKEGRKAMT